VFADFDKLYAVLYFAVSNYGAGSRVSAELIFFKFGLEHRSVGKQIIILQLCF